MFIYFRSVRLWSLDGQQLQELFGHTSFVYSVAALPDGSFVSSGEDRCVKVWKGNNKMKKKFFFKKKEKNKRKKKSMIILTYLPNKIQMESVFRLLITLLLLFGLLLLFLMVILFLAQVMVLSEFFQMTPRE